LRLLLSNQNPLRWAFDLFTRVQLIKKSPIIGSLSYVELCRLCFRSFCLAKIVIFTLWHFELNVTKNFLTVAFS